MALSVVRGLILKEVKVGDADKILTILVKDVGKISASAKSARRTRGSLSSGTSVFTYGDFTVKTGTKHHLLSQSDIIDSFYSLTSDLEVMAYASCLVELADKTTSADMPANETLFLAVNMLKRLADRKISPKLALPVFELKLLQYNGYMPVLDRCAECGGSHDNIMTSVGTLCRSCAAGRPRALPVSETIVYTMRYILAYEPPKLLNFSISDDLAVRLEKITGDMVTRHFGIELKSRKFIDSLIM